jgi:hypothetical protein
MQTEEVTIFSGYSFKLLEAGPWDPNSFGLVDINIIKDEDKLEVLIDFQSEVPIQFEIDSYLWTGTKLLLRTKDKIRWVLKATN